MNESKGKRKGINIRSRALNLLSYRARSVMEIRLALEERGFPGARIEETIEWLKESGYLNDERFASEMAASRVRNKFWGTKKIAFDLGRRGIDAEIISRVTTELSGEGEESVAEKALERWMARRFGAGSETPSLPLDKDVYASAFRHLLSRGFPSNIIYQALKTVKPLNDNDIE